MANFFKKLLDFVTPSKPKDLHPNSKPKKPAEKIESKPLSKTRKEIDEAVEKNFIKPQNLKEKKKSASKLQKESTEKDKKQTKLRKEREKANTQLRRATAKQMMHQKQGGKGA